MHRLSDDILDRMRTREVTGVFHSRKALVAAARNLLVAGVDRADIDVSAPLDELQKRIDYKSIPAADLADMPTTARQPFVDEDDSLTTEVIAGSAAGSVAALAMAFYLVNQRMGSVGVVILSLLCGAIVGGIVLTRVRRRLQRERTMGLDKLSEANGLLIWVRVRSPEKEAQAREILVRHGGQAVHVHEIELAKRLEDLPLHSLRPDPWLGDERLGQP
jgi:hypothetical protein